MILVDLHARPIHTGGIPRLVLPRPKQVLHQLGTINEGISIMLVSIVNHLVAVNLLLTYGVSVVPFHQHIFSPTHQLRPTEHRLSILTQIFVHITHRHIEITACQVALVSINRLEHCTRTARIAARSQLGTVGAGPRGRIHLTVCMVGTLVVHPTIGGIEMKKVGFHGQGFSEPALWNGMFSVVAIPLLRVVAALVSTKSVIIGRRATRLVGIDVPHLSRWHLVGLIVGSPQIPIV